MRLSDLRNRLAGTIAPARAEPVPPDVLPAPAAEAAAPPAVPALRWTRARIAIADELWGEGCVSPGGEEEVLRLAVPLGLSAASSVLLLGAAGGGAARAVAGGLGAWVSGHEADPELAALAAWRLPRSGKVVARRATVVPWDPAAPVFRRRGFNHALALEALRGGPGRPVPVAELLLALAGALQPHGQLVLVDLVAAQPLDPRDPVLSAWATAEGRTPDLPTEAAMSAALQELGFDLRVVEDLSARQIRLAVQGWRRLVRTLAASRPERPRAAAVVAEAEVWLRRLRLMHSGQVRLVRWHGIGRG